jgi:hypothetical protein
MANHGTVGTGDLIRCDDCGKWQLPGYKGGKPFAMTFEDFKKMHKDGLIDASEVLGNADEEDLPVYTVNPNKPVAPIIPNI